MASSHTPSDAAEAAFRNNYAAALAQALREADERSTGLASTNTMSPAEVSHQTYHQLCCDDPMVTFPVQGYAALSQSLISQQQQPSSHSNSSPSSTMSLALSDRLVQGLLFMCQKQARPSTTTTTTTTTTSPNTTAELDDEDDADSDINALPNSTPESLVLPPTTEADDSHAASALAVLAWTVFGRIPLLVGVVHGQSLAQASQLLGSYQGSSTRIHKDTNETNDDSVERNDNDNPPTDEEDARIDQQIDALAKGPPEEQNTPDETDSLQEVWAAESDPSDYDFGPNDDNDDTDEAQQQQRQQAQLAELDAWATLVQQLTDPVTLSQAPNDRQWSDVCHAVANLLQELSFSKVLSHMTLADWRRHRVSEHLTELTMALCLPNQFLAQAAKDDNTTSITDWSHFALQPLHVFRDAVAVHKHALLPDYVQLIQQLLQVQEHLGTNNNTILPSSTASTTTTVAPATWMGLSCLSTLCSNTMEQSGKNSHQNTSQQSKMMIQQLQKCVLSVCDDLCTILESSKESEAASAIPWTVLPIMEILTCIPSGTTTPFLTNAQAQVLLNSGLFRQWLVWWEQQQQQPSTRRVMQRNVLYLCALTPTLLGKYTWRYPGYAAQVTDDAHAEGDENETKIISEGLSDKSPASAVTLLWNLLGIRLAEQQGKTSKVVWKSKKGTQSTIRPSPTVSQCQSHAWNLYATMCKDVTRIIDEWKSRRSNPQEESMNPQENGQQRWESDLQILNEFQELCQSISDLSFILLPIFCFQITPDVDGDAEKAKIAVRKMVMITVQKSLTGWIPAINEPIEPGTKVKTDDNKPGMDENDGDMTNEDSAARMERQRPRMEDSAVAQIRKSVKMLQSAIDSCHPSSMGTTGTSTLTAAVSFSSKAD